jgi:hypothetical protein
MQPTNEPETGGQSIAAEEIPPTSDQAFRRSILNDEKISGQPETTFRISENKIITEEKIYSKKNEIIARNLDLTPSKYQPLNSYDTKLPERNQSQRNYSWEDLAVDELLPSPEKKNKQFLSIGAIASPLYSYRDLGSVNPSVNEYFNESESGKISYSGGIDVGIRAGKRLSFHSGLVYSRMGVSVNNILAVAEMRDAITENAGYYTGATSPYIVSNSIGSIERSEKAQSNYEYTSLNSESKRTETASNLNYMNPGGFYDPASNYVEDEGTIDQYFDYLEVPFLVKYVVIDRKFDLKLLGGLSTNFLVGNSVVYNEGGKSTTIGSTSNIRTVSYSGNVGLGLDYDLRKRFRFILEPQFKYYLNSINSSSLITNRPYTFGLYTGFLFEF